MLRVGFTRLSLEKAAGSGSSGCLAFGEEELVEMLTTGQIGTVRNVQEEMVEKSLGRSWLLSGVSL